MNALSVRLRMETIHKDQPRMDDLGYTNISRFRELSAINIHLQRSFARIVAKAGRLELLTGHNLVLCKGFLQECGLA